MPTINTKPLVETPSNDDILYVGVKQESGYSDGHATVGAIRRAPVSDIYSSKTLEWDDLERYLKCHPTCDNIYLTLPSEINDGVEYPNDCAIQIAVDVNAGSEFGVIIEPSYGAIINAPTTLRLKPGDKATLKRVGLDVWDLIREEADYFAKVSFVFSSKTLSSSDAGRYLKCIGTCDTIFLSLPSEINDGVDWPDGAEIHIRAGTNMATRVVTIEAGYGVTIEPPAGGSLHLQERMTVTLKRVDTDQWDLFGQTTSEVVA